MSYLLDTKFKQNAIDKFLSYFDNSFFDNEHRHGLHNTDKKNFNIVLLEFPKFSVYYGKNCCHSFHFSMSERRVIYKWLEDY